MYDNNCECIRHRINVTDLALISLVLPFSSSCTPPQLADGDVEYGGFTRTTSFIMTARFAAAAAAAETVATFIKQHRPELIPPFRLRLEFVAADIECCSRIKDVLSCQPTYAWEISHSCATFQMRTDFPEVVSWNLPGKSK